MDEGGRYADGLREKVRVRQRLHGKAGQGYDHHDHHARAGAGHGGDQGLCGIRERLRLCAQNRGCDGNRIWAAFGRGQKDEHRGGYRRHRHCRGHGERRSAGHSERLSGGVYPHHDRPGQFYGHCRGRGRHGYRTVCQHHENVSGGFRAVRLRAGRSGQQLRHHRICHHGHGHAIGRRRFAGGPDTGADSGLRDGAVLRGPRGPGGRHGVQQGHDRNAGGRGNQRQIPEGLRQGGRTDHRGIQGPVELRPGWRD